MTIPIDDIRQVPLLNFIEKHNPELGLRRHGNVHKGVCPFHDEKSASFVIFSSNRYKCFGCHESGSIIDFAMKTKNLDFKEACKLVAESAGITYQETPPNPAHEAHKANMDGHTRRYWRCLQADERVKDYLTDRGISHESIVKFRIGLVPQDEYKNRKDMGGISGRIAFPILETKDEKYAKCIGMGYRTLDPNEPAKYINDKNRTDDNDPLKGVFVKGNCLYGYHLAHQEIRKQNVAIVTEGYMDVISLHQSGIVNTVGTMGTALTEGQMDALRKMTRNLILFLDGDKAGVSNMFRVLPQLYEKDFNVLIIIAENNMDPADICKMYNFDVNQVKSYIISNQKPAMSVLIERATEDYQTIVTRERLKALNQTMPILSKMTSPAEAELFKDMLLKRLEMK